MQEQHTSQGKTGMTPENEGSEVRSSCSVIDIPEGEDTSECNYKWIQLFK